MVNDDLVKCPLCCGFTHVDKPELLAALSDPKIRQQVESYIEELLGLPAHVSSGITPGLPHGRNFATDVHRWNRTVPVWRRSPKE